MKKQEITIASAIALCSALQVTTAATLTWNRNLTPEDTGYYSMFDDSNWIVEGEHSGNAPSGYTEGIYSGDDVVIPNGITARWEDPTEGGQAGVRQGRSLTVGTAEPGITVVRVKNHYAKGSLEIRFNSGYIGDPDNDLAAGQWHLVADSGRAIIVKGTASQSFIHNFGVSSYYEFYGTDLAGRTGASATSQIRTSGTPTIYAPDVWYGKLQFRDFKGTFATTNNFVTGGLEWRDSTSCRVVLSADDHVIDTFSFSGFKGSATAGILMENGGSITMQSWPDNQFTGPENFKLDTATIKMFGKANDTKIMMAARGRDDGASPRGFTGNFAIGTFVVGDDAGDIVTIQSPSGPYAEGSESTDAALYVETLDLSSGAGFVIPEGIKVYARKVVGSRDNVTGIERLVVLPTGTTMMIL